VDEAGEYAVLKAGTGEAGRQMLAEGHRLEVGGSSMVGQCTAHAEARIAMGLGEKVIRFDNPLLPETRSEAALPLITHGQWCVGALTVQSVEEDAFLQEDIVALQTIADQLAIAIENARLYNQVQRHASELEERVIERTAELVTVNKELETFAYSVSHDLRAPLRSLDGFSLALLEDYADRLDAGGRDYLQRVRVASQRMGQLIDDLLKLSRLTRAEMHHEMVDLSARMRAIATEFQQREPNRRVEFTVAEGAVAKGDTRLLRAALENLVGNAWKFTSKHPRARIEFGVTRRDGEQVYFVRDDGAGFDMAYAGKLFGAFQRLHSMTEFGGTGIGLATVQRIVHRHGGRVWAEGAEEQGATFYFTLSTEGEDAQQ
jgi:light-regulated signal transduction histidine kinase (bacteriophytochrome)